MPTGGTIQKSQDLHSSTAEKVRGAKGFSLECAATPPQRGCRAGDPRLSALWPRLLCGRLLTNLHQVAQRRDQPKRRQGGALQKKALGASAKSRRAGNLSAAGACLFVVAVMSIGAVTYPFGYRTAAQAPPKERPKLKDFGSSLKRPKEVISKPSTVAIRLATQTKTR